LRVGVVIRYFRRRPMRVLLGLLEVI
jgi:hypothetical protein